MVADSCPAAAPVSEGGAASPWNSSPMPETNSTQGRVPRGRPDRERLAVSWAKVAATGMISRLTGLLREVFFAARFGVSGTMDAYYVATMVVAVISTAVGGTLQASFIAIYSRLVGQGRKDKAASLNSLVLVAVILVAGAAALGAAIAAAPLVATLAPGLAPADARTAASLLRLLAVIAVLGTVDFWSTSLLQSHGVFGAPAGVGIPRNLILVGAAAGLAGLAGVWGLAWATVLAYFAASFWLGCLAFRASRPARPRLASEKPELAAAARLAWPMVLAGVTRQAGAILAQFLASRLGAGSISAITYGARLASIPTGLLGAGVASVLYPTLAREVGAGDRDRAFDLVRRGWIGTALVLAPFGVLLAVLSVPAVQLVYGRGAFGAEAVRLTASATALYALGIVPMGWQLLSARAFYALGDSLTPMRTTLAAVAVNALVALTTTPLLGVGGVALGNAAGSVFMATALSLQLVRRFGRPAGRAFWQSLGKLALACLAGLGTASTLSWLAARGGFALGEAATGGSLMALLAVGLYSGAFLVGYAAVVFGLKIPEAAQAWRSLVGRPRRGRPDRRRPAE